MFVFMLFSRLSCKNIPISIKKTLTIQLDEDAEWALIKPEIFGTIMDFFASGLPVIDENAALPEEGM